MALNYVVLTVDVFDGSGNYPTSGTATFTPSAPLTDTTNHEYIAQIPVVVTFRMSGIPTVKLLATDNGTLAPSGWAWQVSFAGFTGAPAGWNFFLPFAGGASQNLADLAPVSSVTTMAAYLPIDYPTGAASGYVWTSDANGNGSWQAATGGGGGMTNPMTTLGDIIYENATPAAARLAGSTSATKNFLTQTGTGSVSAAPAWGTIAAGDVPTLNQNTTGTAANVTGTVAIGNGGTGQATQQAALDAVAGATTNNQVLAGNGTHVTLRALAAADLPTGTTGAKGALQLDGTATDIQPPGTQAAGSSGLAADGKHVHADPEFALAPANTLAYTMRVHTIANNVTPFTTGGQVAAMSVFLPAGAVIGHIQVVTGATAANGPTHFWVGIADSTVTVRAVSTDNTNGAMAANTSFSFAVTTDGSHAYTVPSAGLYYIVASASASTAVPTLIGLSTVTGVTALTPVIAGTCGTQAAPPSVGTQLNSGTVTPAAIHIAAWCLT